MKITGIKIYQHDSEIKGEPYRMSNTVLTSFDTTIVEVTTDTGLVGYGETCPVGPVYQPQHALGERAALEQMAPALLGCNPLQYGRVYDAMNEALCGFNSAKAAVDIAMWDLCGKFYNVPVSDLLGGAILSKVPSYYSIGVRSIEESVENAKEKVAEGYPRIQVKMGGRPLEEDIEVIQKVSEVLPPGVSLAVDANRGWATRDVIFVSQACRDVRFNFEQVCNTYQENLALRGMVHHPIYLDENTENLSVVIKSLGDGLADGFGIKVTRLGGISVLRHVIAVNREMSKPMTVDDAWGGDIIAAAQVHLGSTLPRRLNEGVWLAAPYIEGHYDAKNGIDIVNGHIDVPTGPGLGIEPDNTIWGEPVLVFGQA